MITKNKILTYWDDYRSIYSNMVNHNGTIKMFIKEVETLAKTLDDNVTTYKGDMLEVLAELFFDAFSNDRQVGLSNYEPNLDADYGVDGIGINTSQQRCAVQVKYRSNASDPITYGDLAKTFTDGTLNFNLDLTLDRSIYLFTTADDISISCKTMLSSNLVIINRAAISNKINNNKVFWTAALTKIHEVRHVNDQTTKIK